MSFLKGMALDYFEPFLDTPDDEPDWLEDYKLFIEELLINFGPYNALVVIKTISSPLSKKKHKNKGELKTETRNDPFMMHIRT